MKNKSDKMMKDTSKKVLLKFNFPEHGFVIEAKNIDEANEKAQKLLSKQK